MVVRELEASTTSRSSPTRRAQAEERPLRKKRRGCGAARDFEETWSICHRVTLAFLRLDWAEMGQAKPNYHRQRGLAG